MELISCPHCRTQVSAALGQCPSCRQFLYAEALPQTGGYQPAGPWGAWTTLAFSLLIVGLFVVVEGIVAIVYLIVNGAKPGADFAALSEEYAAPLFLFPTWAAMPACLLAILFFVYLSGSPIREYLALKPVSWRATAVWLAAVVAFIAIVDALTYLLGQPIVPEFSQQLYRVPFWRPFVWLTLPTIAPLFEETFFRGFMIAGLRRHWGSGPAIIISSLAWAAIHMQYSAPIMGTIFILGLLLGTARVQSGSLYPSLAMHVLTNCVATLEAAWQAQ